MTFLGRLGAKSVLCGSSEKIRLIGLQDRYFAIYECKTPHCNNHWFALPQEGLDSADSGLCCHLATLWQPPHLLS